MCAKLSGIPWYVSDTPFSEHDDTMLVGIDVYHKTGKVSKSVLAYVSTTDKNFARYFSDTHF